MIVAGFADAGAMLDAFNAAVSVPLPSDQTLTRLERYRVWKTQRQISVEFHKNAVAITT